MNKPQEQKGNKETKILIILTASVATSLAFVVPWFTNHMRYEEYSKEELRIYTQRNKETAFYGLGNRLMSKQKLEITKCLNRYRKENHSFALALTACKQEPLIPLFPGSLP